jgi:hypothetical protein
MKKSNRINELLKTNEIEKQAEIIKGLIEAASSPVIDLIIRHDPRTGSTTPVVIGANIDYPTAYAILDQARAILHQAELEQAAGKPVPIERGDNDDSGAE